MSTPSPAAPAGVHRRGGPVTAVKVLAVLAGAPLAGVLLLGAALGGAPLPTGPAQGTPPAYPNDLPGPPAAFPGPPGGGCSVPDPTGTGGCVTETTGWLLTQIGHAFGPLPTSCWDAHAWNPDSDHPLGRACDIGFGTPATFPGPPDVARGWLLAQWLHTTPALCTSRT